MDKKSVKNMFVEMSNAGKFAPIQLKPISHILDAACPDSICKIDKAVVLSYFPENVHVSLNTFDVVIRDLFNDKYEKWNIDDHPRYIPAIEKDSFGERAESPNKDYTRSYGLLRRRFFQMEWCHLV